MLVTEKLCSLTLSPTHVTPTLNQRDPGSVCLGTRFICINCMLRISSLTRVMHTKYTTVRSWFSSRSAVP